MEQLGSLKFLTSAILQDMRNKMPNQFKDFLCEVGKANWIDLTYSSQPLPNNETKSKLKDKGLVCYLWPLHCRFAFWNVWLHLFATSRNIDEREAKDLSCNRMPSRSQQNDTILNSLTGSIWTLYSDTPRFLKGNIKMPAVFTFGCSDLEFYPKHARGLIQCRDSEYNREAVGPVCLILNSIVLTSGMLIGATEAAMRKASKWMRIGRRRRECSPRRYSHGSSSILTH